MPTSSPKILITGGHGQLAHALRQHKAASSYQLICLSRSELDITKPAEITQQFELNRPDFVINTAAYTAVDKAEQELELADAVNHQGPRHLATACTQQQITLLHLSTDYIFDGKHTIAYNENDAAHPINQYGMSKWLGEQAIRELCPKHIILRVSGIFSNYGNNYFKTMVRLADERDELHIVNDQFTCPTSAEDIANTLFHLIQNYTHSGTYHFCSQPKTSWYEFTRFLMTELKNRHAIRVKQIHPISSIKYNAPATRPLYSVLNCAKINKDYGISQPSWENAIIDLINKGVTT